MAQPGAKRTFVLVHGAWSGGWDYARVDSILTARGDLVYRPTLTGLGERVHLSNAKINLTTYINDVVNVIRFENLSDVVLVGHSFGGMVISGVAEQLPDRISRLIYLDAMVPNDGESARDVCGKIWDGMIAPFVRDSLVLYPFGATSQSPPMDVPQPLGTYLEPLRISNPAVRHIPTSFIAMTKNGQTNAGTDKMGVDRARVRNWPVFKMEGGHYAMREQPANLVKKFDQVLAP
ncbi:MAG: alpha/beta hydrolase [Dyadobacter sp.]|uniref:alpha/beta hydrolase n=1 Tax=Dyadobacter sp. TaxID=1914288 RepID=UPI001B2A65AF|nr:alpha/beta fold hydrolase [Dyadobacter sp.]MBO9616462.1 alpha/beta hydrolase [Dyadobacter sp.]